MKAYRTVQGTSEYEFTISRSRFIATVASVADGNEAEIFVKQTAKKYSDATHNCYAYISDICGNAARFSDAGEPSGTAGMPMLEVLKKRGLSLTAVVVTRYFGGVKLGAGGLVSAYTKAVAGAIDKVGTVEYVLSCVFQVKCAYQYLKPIISIYKAFNVQIINIDYACGITLEVAVEQTKYEEVKAVTADITSGSAIINYINTDYIKF